MEQSFRILAINPGSTSTKIAIYENERELFELNISHSQDDIAGYSSIIEQYDFRKQVILKALEDHGMNLSRLAAVVGRGGLLKPIEGGTYRVNDEMLRDLQNSKNGEHASNLGAILADEIAHQLNIEAFIVDPVVVDELDDVARISGVADFERKSIFHALNQKAVARKVANDLDREYEQLNLIVCHMGGGITIGSHKKGRVVDVNNGLHGEGPFSPERAGTVPAGDLVSMCFSGAYYAHEVMKKIVGQGGLVGHLGTNDAREVEERIKAGDENAAVVYDAMAYQIAKEISSHAAVFSGDVDAIVLTGGLAYGESFVDKIRSRVQWISSVIVEPGENEMQALTEGALRVMRKQERARHYPNRKT